MDIALPAYNCAPWLDAFLESLLAQDYTNWRVIARDDASRDDTAGRLAAWQSRLGSRMVVLEGGRNLGVIGNYNAVFEATESDLVMSADPDDVWLPGKIRRSLEAIRDFDPAVPLGLCTDARVIDAEGRDVAPSFWKWSRMNPARRSVPQVAMESVALGSTMMFNRALLDVAVPMPSGATYQDWWLALAAAAFGRLIPLAEPTILYRRHASNATSDPYSSQLSGAVRRTLGAPGAPRRRLRQVVAQAVAQASAFRERYRGRLAPSDAAALDALAGLLSTNPLCVRAAILRHGLWFGSPLKNAGLLALL
jgi:Glycosyl transferase family 2